ncbi:MAG: TonB-dependent receptor [Acidobacteria bacterium]|nr:TonB-dependent receptor [Acidobacteriota bacterium]
MFAVLLAMAAPALAQSQAINGTIEGTIVDASGGVLPGVTVTITNTDTGASRSVVTNESGVYRAPLLPLGTYKVAAELSGFKRFEQTGISLAAGQTAVVNLSLSVGEMTEVVSVVADTPVVDLGKIDQGRTLNEREIKELPLTSRNPYNFALLQPGVTGFETQEFGVPRLTANGALLRVNYQIDGNDNTEKDRAGLRQMPMSEVMIREVKVVTTGYAPEFGQTMGLVYNAITPSGTNAFKGQASYRMQRKDFAALPFFATTRVKPPTDVNVFTAGSGGPLAKDRTFYFGGFERAKRDFSGGRVITIRPENAARLGLNEPGFMPAAGDTKFAIGKADHQLSQANRLTVRYIFFDNFITNNIGGGLNSVQRGTNFKDRQHSTAAQLVSTIGQAVLNEARVQYATRDQSRVPGDQAGSGPAIAISGVANFGGPVAGGADAGFGFTERIFQVLDNVTVLRGDHSYKFGFSAQFVHDTRTQTQFQLYTFPTIDAYLAAAAGANPRSYTTFTQFFGEPSFEYDTRMYAFFVQDDWRLTPAFKLLYGLRYDVYATPDGVANAPIDSSRNFEADKNNWQPRAGFVWTLDSDQRTVLRGNTGLMYDQPLNAIYEQALINNGTAARGGVTLQAASVGSPAFPNVLTSGTVQASTTAWTVDDDFRIARMWQSNLQLERALGQYYSAAIGFSYSKGYDLPVVSNINVTNPIGSLPDGRPIYSTAVGAGTRVDPRYNALFATQAIGESTYRNMTLQFGRRFHRGIQWDLSYTLGKSEDTAPIPGTLSVQGDVGRSDPSNLERDKGPNILDQRHSFVGSIVARPEFQVDGVAGAILNNNQFGIALLFANGIPVNLRSNRELNNDAIGSDRPNGVARNSLSLPARKNVDFRYTRGVPLRGTARAEVIAEVKNIFNTVQWSGVSSVVPTDTLGSPLSPLPASGDELRPSGGYEQRQFQLGFKILF